MHGAEPGRVKMPQAVWDIPDQLGPTDGGAWTPMRCAHLFTSWSSIHGGMPGIGSVSQPPAGSAKPVCRLRRSSSSRR